MPFYLRLSSMILSVEKGTMSLLITDTDERINDQIYQINMKIH